MNRRQKKKQFKKRYGFNPPRSFSIQTAKRIAENREKIIAAFERLKRASLDLWESIKKPALELAEAIKAATAFISEPERKRRQYIALVDFQTKVLLQQRQQEREVKQIESNINILNHDRR